MFRFWKWMDSNSQAHCTIFVWMSCKYKSLVFFFYYSSPDSFNYPVNLVFFFCQNDVNERWKVWCCHNFNVLSVSINSCSNFKFFFKCYCNVQGYTRLTLFWQIMKSKYDQRGLIKRCSVWSSVLRVFVVKVKKNRSRAYSNTNKFKTKDLII